MEKVDLRLRLGSSSSSSSGGGGGDDDEPSTAGCNSSVARSFESSGGYQQRRQQITLLYDGRICACDVTEIQARAIIAMAKREMDGHMKKTTQAHRQPMESSSPRPVERLLINPELSMKRSLQRFLQKRKSRLDALSPYGHRPQHLYPIKS
ncbi:hypothetical protein B296_00037721 [Ensete ventricosum]|uniref:Tify domain-containing protein n=1 Tax=Ensete ventricosum TaxID=4639 RepID=A0A426YM28_ENSVE|nr:hypothetical protein B296_00037721 [Ensete ventricosum]